MRFGPGFLFPDAEVPYCTYRIVLLKVVFLVMVTKS
jgi:hypothetical protein